MIFLKFKQSKGIICFSKSRLLDETILNNIVFENPIDQKLEYAIKFQVKVNL